MDRHQRRMQQKRDEYLPKRRVTLSKHEVKKLDDDYWKWVKQHLYTVRVWRDGRMGLCSYYSKFPQRYPPFDRVMKELLQDWQKKQAQRSCRQIKEELMMNRWHPARVEKLLELGLLDEEEW